MDFDKFLVNFFLFFFVIYFLGISFLPAFFKKLVASGVVLSLSFLGKEAIQKGLEITVSSFSFSIINSCTGIVSFSIFAGLMAATNWLSLKKKVLYSLLVVPVFLAWNVLRISLSSFTGSYGLFVFLHDSLWVLGTGLILVLYVLAVDNYGK